MLALPGGGGGVGALGGSSTAAASAGAASIKEAGGYCCFWWQSPATRTRWASGASFPKWFSELYHFNISKFANRWEVFHWKRQPGSSQFVKNLVGLTAGERHDGWPPTFCGIFNGRAVVSLSVWWFRVYRLREHLQREQRRRLQQQEQKQLAFEGH